MAKRHTALEIGNVLETYESVVARSDDADARGEAQRRALASLDSVAVRIDPEHDHALEALLHAARERVTSE